ncbi:putative Transposase-containing protein 4 [Homarus americanus]|uniref:Putative Transposase-containing protein 4 n=1 Tax=Homarus americanus TaxID=6706 RepID=A0A8J5JXS7_HOMAM|nr:putative Transposase-containing protein 4 [Homarus americanus]
MNTTQQRLTTRGQIVALREEGLTVRAITRPTCCFDFNCEEVDQEICRNGEALHLDSAQTVRSRLHEAGIQHRVLAIKERLTEQHLTRRLQFAQQYVGEDLEFWSRVVFTDEKTFASPNHGKTHLWRPNRTR